MYGHRLLQTKAAVLIEVSRVVTNNWRTNKLGPESILPILLLWNEATAPDICAWSGKNHPTPTSASLGAMAAKSQRHSVGIGEWDIPGLKCHPKSLSRIQWCSVSESNGVWWWGANPQTKRGIQWLRIFQRKLENTMAEDIHTMAEDMQRQCPWKWQLVFQRNKRTKRTLLGTKGIATNGARSY